MRRDLILPMLWMFSLFACTLTTVRTSPTPAGTDIPVDSTFWPPTGTAASIPTNATQAAEVTQAGPLTETPLPVETANPAPSPTLPTVERLDAQVSADLLSCRYGPGAEYLYLYALRKTANIQLIGRTDANNWVWVDGTNKCWVNAKFLDIQGDPLSLPIVYPGRAKLPVSAYYPGPSWANATRKGDSVQITWEAVPISPGKYEDENMHQYIVEVWRCEDGQILFETLGTNLPFITVEKDEAGCATASHGRVFVQEKHGYGGPAEIPWPEHP